MKPGTTGYAGGGIYFADNPEATYRKACNKGTVLQCEIHLGRVQEAQLNVDYSVCNGHANHDHTGEHVWLQPGYDTINITSLHGHEVVVYEPERVKHCAWHSGTPVDRVPAAGHAVHHRRVVHHRYVPGDDSSWLLAVFWLLAAIPGLLLLVG